MRALLLLHRETGNQKYLEPIPRALAYYKRSVLPEVTSPSEVRRRVCRAGAPCMARFYELQTNRPLYITKGTRVTAIGQGPINVDGYELSYSDASVITHYAVVTSGAGFDAIEREFTAVRNSPPGSLKRLDKLRGLSPWSEMQAGNTVTAGRGGDRRDLGSRVQAAIDAMDARGAWVEDGVIGKANRLASVLAAGDLIVTVGGKTIPVKENETVEVFSGPEPPRQRMTICDALRRSGRSDIELYQLPRELEAVVQAGDTAVLQDAFG